MVDNENNSQVMMKIDGRLITMSRLNKSRVQGAIISTVQIDSHHDDLVVF